ncbi:hypothetical protein [Marisediminicola sp. LYQ85]|uniref:hypothetical protein n=1 Tax=Marisediminicola sp. LYQ85 TaxID=3391062 RepID=UPI0039836CD8
MALLVALVTVSVAGCVADAPETEDAAPGGSSAPLRDDEVEAPGGGTIDDTVDAVEPGDTVEVSLDEAAELPSDVIVEITETRRETVSANTPGEIAGPAVIVGLRVVNDTASDLDLGSTVVSLVGADGTLGQPTTAGPADPFTSIVSAGNSAEATYVFTDAPSGVITLSVSYAGGAPIALFTGDVS